MKKVLCFGDSNTHGYNPENGLRYDENCRWTGILKKLSGNEFQIVEAGCNNRTAFTENPQGDLFTGRKAILNYLRNYYDILILALGINDLQKVYNTNLNDIKQGISNLVETIIEISPKTKIVLVSPAEIGDNVLFHDIFSKLFDEKSIEKSTHYSKIFKKIADEFGCVFVDWNLIVEASEIDGLHFSENSHKVIANKMYQVLKEIE